MATPQGWLIIAEIFLASSIDPAFNLIHACVVIETQAEHIFGALRSHTISINAFPWRIHNFAVTGALCWLKSVAVVSTPANFTGR